MNDLQRIKKNLQSDDASVRKTTLEQLFGEELSQDLIPLVCELVKDEDKGVRDNASMLITFNIYPDVPKYIVEFVYSKDISIRNIAGEILIKNGLNSVDTLIANIEKGNSDDDKFIIDVLGLIGDKKPAARIIEVLNTSKDENVILACFEALGNIGCEKCVDTLIERFDENELFNPTIIEALGKIGDTKSLNYLLKVYPKQDVLSKFAIIESLGRLGNEETIEFLVSELQVSDNSLKGAIVFSMHQVIEKYNVSLNLDTSIRSHVIKTLSDLNNDYVLAAVKLLSAYKEESIIYAFLEIVGIDFQVDEEIKQCLFDNHECVVKKIPAMVKEEHKNAKGMLILMKELLELKGIEEIQVLSEVEKRDLVNSLINYINDPDEELRMTITELLFAIDVPSALMFADKLAEDDNIWNRLKLLEMLSYAEGDEIESLLKKLMNDPEEMVRERAEMLLNNNQSN